MTKQEALAIAAEYRDRKGYETTIDEHTKATLYDRFEHVDGAAWLIEAALPPSSFEGSGTLTYVVSVDAREVAFIINSSGFNHFPGDDEGFDDDEIAELKAMGFDVIE